MKLDEAMLLPNVYKEFKSEVFANISQFPSAKSLSENDLPNSHWLLSQFHMYFETKSLYSADTRGMVLYCTTRVVISLRLFPQHLERPMQHRTGQLTKAGNVLHVHVQVHVLAPH